MAQAVRTLRAHCPQVARRSRTGRCVVARTGVVSWQCPTVSQVVSQRALAVLSAQAPVSSPPPVTIQKIVSQLNPCRVRCRACHSVPASCRRALLRRIAAPGVPCRDAKPTPPVTIQMIVSRHTLLAKPRERALPLSLARGSAVSWLCWPCCGAVSQLYHAVSWRATARPPRPCVTIQFVVS